MPGPVPLPGGLGTVPSRLGTVLPDGHSAELPSRHTDARSLLIAATAPLYHQLLLLRADPDPRLPERAAEAAVLAAIGGGFSGDPVVGILGKGDVSCRL